MLQDDWKRWKDDLSLLLDDAAKKCFQAAIVSILYLIHTT